MEIGRNNYSGSYYDRNRRIAVVQGGQDAVQSAIPSPPIPHPNQAESSLKVPSMALASAMWQMMVRRANDSSDDRLIV